MRGRFDLRFKWNKVRGVAFAMVLLGVTAPACIASNNEPFAPPKPEELSMTSVPGYPGVPAAVLYLERIDSAPLRSTTVYERIKVLNEDGKKYANVVLASRSTSLFSVSPDYDSSITDIMARTIHVNGTIIPFIGKPFERTAEKVKGEKRLEKILTLPDVEVGSILEFRYTMVYVRPVAPDWILQGELFVKAAHYRWDEGKVDYYSTTWLPFLPPGVQLEKSLSDTRFDVNVKDLAPLPNEDYLPPSSSYVYRVMFNLIEETSVDEYWKNAPNNWAHAENDFLHGNGDVKSKVQELTAGTKTQDEALKRIYAFVMSLENLSYMRDYDKKENKAQGKREVHMVSDILANKRGYPGQLNELFIAMARAAGMKAYGVLVPDRSEDVFIRGWLTLYQFDALISLVNVDGKDMFFDPGVADCPYGQLPWQYTLTTGVRQTDSGGGFINTPLTVYSRNKQERIADLAMDASGVVDGSVKVTYYGAPALAWRHVARQGDDESFRKDLKEAMVSVLPKGFDVSVTDIKALADYESPLVVTYHVQGQLASKAGKRLLVPADLLVARESSVFNNPKRDLQVYFHYPEVIGDAVRVKFPDGLTVEGVPEKALLKYEDTAGYTMSTTTTANSFTTQRSHVTGMVIVQPEKYGELRDFYSKFESKDHESVVLKPATATASVRAPEPK